MPIAVTVFAALMERIRRAQVALSAAKDTIAALAVRGTGRTLLIYLSDGYGEPELAGELEKIAAAAWRANAPIYALDTRSLLGPDVELTAANWSRWDSHRVVAQDGLRRLAEGNEGQLIWTRSDLDSALQQIALTRK